MRDVDPFDYWESHSSAIGGLGGRERSPDPRYCFHTRYHEVRPGRARYVVRLEGVRASFGELSVRVHAWKPNSDSDVILVSGGRMALRAEDEAEAELTLPVHFASQAGVLYAFYGYFSEDTDITAQKLQVAIDEPEEPGEPYPEPPRSILAMDRAAEETRPANALLHYGRTRIDHPVSQSCTREQVAALGRQRGEDDDAAIARWSETVCVTALDTYGGIQPGFEGLVVGPVSEGFAQPLAAAASLTHLTGAPPPRTSDAFFDFLLMPGGLETATAAPPATRERWETVEDWLARLKIGGLAVLGLRYRPDGDLVSSSASLDTDMLSRNEIGQWALRLIGGGYSVAPLAFAPLPELALDSRGLAAFVLIVQRL